MDQLLVRIILCIYLQNSSYVHTKCIIYVTLFRVNCNVCGMFSSLNMVLNCNLLSIVLLGQDVDYGSGQHNITISAGNTNVSLNIVITDDNLFEGDEEFYLMINQSLSLSRIVIGSPNRAVVKIFDDECK